MEGVVPNAKQLEAWLELHTDKQNLLEGVVLDAKQLEAWPELLRDEKQNPEKGEMLAKSV